LVLNQHRDHLEMREFLGADILQHVAQQEHAGHPGSNEMQMMGNQRSDTGGNSGQRP